MKNKISPKMTEVLKVLSEHKELVKYHGGFWSWKSVELKRTTYNRMNNFDVPIWWCGIETLRALHKRGFVTLDETNNICKLREG